MVRWANNHDLTFSLFKETQYSKKLTDLASSNLYIQIPSALANSSDIKDHQQRTNTETQMDMFPTYAKIWSQQTQ